MRAFAELYARLDATTKTSVKIEALREYFAEAPPADAVWTVYFLSGRRLKRFASGSHMREWASELAGIPAWLFDECYDAVGDLAETIALLTPPTEPTTTEPLHVWVEDRLLPLRAADEETRKRLLQQAWRSMDSKQQFVWNKLITGAFRVGVSQRLVVRALAEVSGLEAAVIAHRLMGSWEPTPEFYERLLGPEDGDVDASRPYPFLLAHPLESPPESLGQARDWQAEWKWDGIRSQLVRRGGQTYLWSRGEELIMQAFPEILEDAPRLADGTVLDGEIVAWKEEAVLPFGELQRRIGRKSVGKKILGDVPAVFMAFDLLEQSGRDIRGQPLRHRREELERLLSGLDSERIRLSPAFVASSWEELAARRDESRGRNVEGLMLKRLDSGYAVGRPRGVWWKWKIEPYSVDAVLIYAQRGHGRRASLYTDYTFGVWDNEELVPFAKAYSGLTDNEILAVDRFVRNNTIERFGPVRAVKPELVFELAFENIRRSKRHKSGIAVRFPRMARWRTDKRPEEADSLETIRSLLPESERG